MFNRKLTENKFKPEVPRPELVEDWDQVNSNLQRSKVLRFPDPLGTYVQRLPRLGGLGENS